MHEPSSGVNLEHSEGGPVMRRRFLPFPCLGLVRSGTASGRSHASRPPIPFRKQRLVLLWRLGPRFGFRLDSLLHLLLLLLMPLLQLLRLLLVALLLLLSLRFRSILFRHLLIFLFLLLRYFLPFFLLLRV
jgi:hypothetical protein